MNIKSNFGDYFCNFSLILRQHMTSNLWYYVVTRVHREVLCMELNYDGLKNTTKEDLLKVRMTKDQKTNLKLLAKKKGLNMSEYVMYCILKVESLELREKIDFKI